LARGTIVRLLCKAVSLLFIEHRVELVHSGLGLCPVVDAERCHILQQVFNPVELLQELIQVGMGLWSESIVGSHRLPIAVTR